MIMKISLWGIAMMALIGRRVLNRCNIKKKRW
jgi:hypothetical protein